MENGKICYICEKRKLKIKTVKTKNCCKVRDHSHYKEEHRGAAQNICNLKNSIPKAIPIAFHNGSNHDYHFIIR